MIRLSEFIAKLEEMKESHGDVPVVIDHSDYRPNIAEGVEIYYERLRVGADGVPDVPCVVLL